MLRALRECDLFRKLPPEHREARAPPSAAETALQGLAALLIVALATSEAWNFATPLRKQRFDLDMQSSVDASAPRKIRVMLNVTVHDFPCIDLSLDYQDVMGTRAVDVRSTIFKQRLHKNGSFVGDVVQNNPKAAVGGGPSNPSISRNYTGNKTCGTCYGALPEGECCNTCSDVLYAYRLKRWALPRIESIEQCKHDGSGKPAYQPPQIIRFDDYSPDDYLPKFSRLGSLSSSANEARITTPFKLNFTFEPLKPLRTASSGFQPLAFNFSRGSAFLDDEDDWSEEEGGDGNASSGKAKTRATRPWPDCVRRNVVVHGYDLGEALMADLTKYGAKTGCWNDDCTSTDKFDSPTMARCAEVCREVASCHWWTFGSEDLTSKCWIRTGRHGREKRYGFTSGPRSCAPPANTTDASGSSSSSSTAAPSQAEDLHHHVHHEHSDYKGHVMGTEHDNHGQGDTQPRRLLSFEDDYDSGARPFTLNFGPSLHMPVFGMDTRESQMRKEQKGESCMIHGYFDTNKVPGNFHIGTHGAAAPSYLSYWDEPVAPSQSMQHTINRLAFVEVGTGVVLNETQPLDGFESPKAFTFQYYLTITPGTARYTNGTVLDGYQFRAGSFVTNELIGPAVFFRMDIDPIRVTYYTEEVRWSRFLVNICAVVGGCIALCSMLVHILENATVVACGGD